ncbi:MAG: ABC transporter ATP-binding protein [Acutalibacteraceae bacterium]|nr:ABC transporter ATP-binding protein [Acutalibacteraceae bacterium]
MKDNFKYMLSNWLKWDKKSLKFFFLWVPALVLQPLVTAYIPKAMIDAIDNGVTVGDMTVIVALLSLLLTLTIWLDPFMKELVRGGARIVRMRYAVAAFRKTLTTDYVNIESYEGREKQKRAEAFYNARFSSGADFVEQCAHFLVCVIGVIASSVLLYKVNYFMILLILLTCVCEFFLLKILKTKQSETTDNYSKLSGKFEYFYKLSKNAEASKDIKLYGFSDYLVKTAADFIYQIEHINAKYTKQSAAISGVRALLNLVRELVAYAYLTYLVLKNRLSVSEFIFCFGIITGFSNWIMNLVFSFMEISRCCTDCALYREFVEESVSEGKPEVDFGEVRSIEFSNVFFTYPASDTETIRNMSFKVNKGENIAIVGENGAGKTTAIKLLCGLYYPSEGDILINGRSSKEFSSDSYFDLFSAVFQDYCFMPMTIAENITAEQSYDKERLFAAFDKAGITDKINSLSEKENTLMVKDVYKNAADFSGGEKQKLLLAKAVYKNAPVLVLDEPTAALDPISENELYLKYNELTEDKISFFISHRLSSTRFCDRILFIKDGAVAESGTHEELMAKKGAYYRMYQTQSMYYREMGVAVNE